MEFPKVLIITRSALNDSDGRSSTLTNLFDGYDRDKVASIFIETKQPKTKCYSRYFQISEYSLIRKIFHPSTQTGFDLRVDDGAVVNIDYSRKEEGIMSWVRRHRSIIFSWMREFLWGLNGWQTKELRDFILDFSPDVIWMDGSPLILMNRLHRYVKDVCKKPNVYFVMDDIYSYPKTLNPLTLLDYRRLRKLVNHNITSSDKVYVASPKMKQEYDMVFSINSSFLSKGADFSKIKPIGTNHHEGIKLVYLGQAYCGRIYTLIDLVNKLKEKNDNGAKFFLTIYSNDYIKSNLKKKVQIEGVSTVRDAVPYTEIPRVMQENDVLLFVETLKDKFKNLARLSFSTKIVDYLVSGKCIMAIGHKDIAPICYFKDNNIAFVADNENEINKNLEKLLDEKNRLIMAKNSFDFARRNHEIRTIHEELHNTFINMTNNIAL